MDNTERTKASSGTPRVRRAPPGWVAPGPPGSAREVALGPHEDLSYLVGDWRIIQRRDGHRWSLDDLVTAWVARDTGLALERAGREVRAILDLGSGIGSVALMMGWCFPAARVTGVEAQALSWDLARRSAWANGVEERYDFVHGDLRQVPLERGVWDLVSGTPPYFDDAAQPRSNAVQKTPCRFEERGGAADYLAAMAAAMAPGARAVMCHASRQRARVLAAIAASPLCAVRRLEVLPKALREPLVDVFVLAADGSPGGWEQLAVRDANDQWTPEFLGVRLAMGMPPRP